MPINPTSRVTTYDANEQILTICGLIIDSGFADGEFLSIEPGADGWGFKVGTDGEVARYKTNNKTAVAHVKLMRGSLGNTKLAQLYARDQATSNGAGVGAFQLEDRSSGTTVAHAAHCWIQKQPSPSRGREESEVDWTIFLADATLDLSGSPSLP